MSKLPKLEVRRVGDRVGESRDFEQAKYLPFHDFLIFVEGQQIYSCEELIRLAGKDCHKDKKFLEVVLLPMLVNGG